MKGVVLKLGAAVILLSTAYLCSLPDVAAFKLKNPSTTAYIELRQRQAQRAGQPFVKKMTWVNLGHISEHLKHAVLIAEDDMFYSHQGVDYDALRVALERNWKEKRLAYGASTITQQVARNLYLSPLKNPLRKIKELFITWRLEKTLGKRRIFEIYLNIAEWGKGIFGVEAAAQAYFGKHASELTPEESAALAAVLPNPRRYNPASNSRYVARNSGRILSRMRASGFLPENLPAEIILDLSTETVVIPLVLPAQAP